MAKFQIIQAIIILLIIASIGSSFAQCDCDFTISTNDTEWFFDGEVKGVKPGDQICFASGQRGAIELRNIHGTAENPVIVKNMCDGKVTISSPPSQGNCIPVRNCSYLRITGGNNPNEEYGIELTGAVMGLSLINRTTDVEADHFYIHDIGGVGIEAKTDPSCDESTWRGNFEMNNVYIHHNYLDQIGGEGFYIGNSHYVHGVTKTCDGSEITVYEHDMHNCEVSYNIVKNIQLDGIQISAVLDNLSVHHNYVYNYAIEAKYGHQSGIQIGAACHGIMYNNYVEKGTGYCFFDGGRGNSQYYNNICKEVASGFLKQKSTPYWDGASIYANNIILNPKEKGFHLFSDEGHIIVNNLLISDQSDFKWVSLNSSSIQYTDLNNIKTEDISSIHFVDPNSNDFHLQKNSPAISAGMNVINSYGMGLNFDMDKRPRPSGTESWDIGPYQYFPVTSLFSDKALEKQSLLIYPNPASNAFYIDLTDFEDMVEMNITNVLGQTIVREKIAGGSIQPIGLQTVKDGIYTVTLSSDQKGSVSSERIVVRK